MILSGLIAQELKDVKPEAVTEVEMTKFDGEVIHDFHLVDERALVVGEYASTIENTCLLTVIPTRQLGSDPGIRQAGRSG